jgi:hypothetical protein
MLKDTTPRLVIPTLVWQSYNYLMNLNVNFSARLNFGYSYAGTYDIDSISLVRIGNVVSALAMVYSPNANIRVVQDKIKVISTTNQQIEIFSKTGSKLFSKKLKRVNQAFLFIIKVHLLFECVTILK